MKTITQNECILLGLLSEAPGYGYQIEQKINERGMKEWTEIAFSSIYYLLNKLEKEGLVSSMRISGIDRPSKKQYQLTDIGWQALRSNIYQYLANPQPFSPDFSIGLAFSVLLPVEERTLAMQQYANQLGKKIAEVEENWRSQIDAPPHVTALFKRSLHLMWAEFEWLRNYLHPDQE